MNLSLRLGIGDDVISYPKRLIEVDLPIFRISAHARREKSIRHGHISTLHIWWARRPLAACRAVICAALWPDPADENCPRAFRDAAARLINEFARKADGDLKLLATSSEESKRRWATLVKKPLDSDSSASLAILRSALLDFIADFANWDNSTVVAYLETSRGLTQAAHEALGGEPGTRPLVVDPFAGGGSIPLEALRVGADAFASDLNPVPVLLNKVVLEYIPKYGQRLADEVRKWGEWIKKKAEKELAAFYPKDADGATPIAYLWARTIRCEGAGCGAEIPLVRSLWLAKKANRSVALQILPNLKGKRVDFKIIVKQRDGWVDQTNPKTKIDSPKFDGMVKRGSATCPCCGYTTPVARVREQFRAIHGGANDARLFCVVTTTVNEAGRSFRLPVESDFAAAKLAVKEIARLKADHKGPVSLVPDEPLPPQGTLGFRVQLYGMTEWGNLFTPRQLLTLVTLVRLVGKVKNEIKTSETADFVNAVVTLLGMGVSRIADISNSLCNWSVNANQAVHLFGRQAIPIMWDFAETSVLSDAAGDYGTTIRNMARILEGQAGAYCEGHAEQANAAAHPLPNDSASAFVTDPPYYDAVPYADLSDFFYVWLKRAVPDLRGHGQLTPKDAECIVDEVKGKDGPYFERTMKQALSEGRRVLCPSGVGVVVFAHKSTAGWETLLQAMVEAGWIMTGSWPIDTERPGRLRAQDSAALASSVHLVCRPRENVDGTVIESVGDWRDVLQELPKRIHEWMPRLAAEGVVGADAIFACLGPALEIFSRYSRVERTNGEVVPLGDEKDSKGTVTKEGYLSHVWAAVSTEALSMIFRDADAAGLEPDARLTAMWLWTLGGAKTAMNGNSSLPEAEGEEDMADDEEAVGAKAKPAGYTLEFDAARKIAQGLGIHLDKNESIVAVKGETARLLPVAERTQYLFGKDATAGATGTRKGKKKAVQKTLFDELDDAEAAEAGWTELKGPPPGTTVLDRLHQTMILFAAGRGELMKRFLLDDGVGRDARFWKLAQSLSALYPAGTDEKRWVDGVLARKKGLGL